MLERAWQPTPVFLPAEPHGQKSLVGCSLWGSLNYNCAVRGTAVYKALSHVFTDPPSTSCEMSIMTLIFPVEENQGSGHTA